MHSSRMHTGRALTIWGGASQKIFWGKKIEKKKKKKFWRTPPKIGEPPQKLETPLKNWRPSLAPTPKLETTTPPPGPDLPPPL